MARKATKKPAKSRAKTKDDELAPSGLTWRQEKFCLEYCLDGNGTQAAIRAGYSPNTARVQACDLLTKPNIRKRLGELQSETAKKLKLDHATILSRYWQTATADVNEIVSLERRCCRYCHGKDHAYQWTTQREYRETYDQAAVRLAAGDPDLLIKIGNRFDAGERVPTLPTDEGGYGFDATAFPHPDCPECHGEGIPHVNLHDTRNTVSHPLFEGVKQSQHGVEIKIADRLKALDQAARHLEFFKDSVRLDASEELMKAARRINDAAPALDPDYMAKNASRLEEDDE